MKGSANVLKLLKVHNKAACEVQSAKRRITDLDITGLRAPTGCHTT